MAKNLFLVLAKELGLEPYDEFLMSDYGEQVFTFTEKGLCYVNDNGGETKYVACSSEPLADLVVFGEDFIVKLPFNPEDGDTYYAADVLSREVGEYIWEDNTVDYALKRLGLIYPLHEIAEENLKADLEKLTGVSNDEYWGNKR